MTKEIRLLLEAFDRVDFSVQKAALATVVHVEGSSYRRPGARMLVTDDGKLTGAISGGCLEGDALRKARLVMMRGEAMVVTYDTSDGDDARLGIGLGCNGVISILIEPIHPEQPMHPIALLRRACLPRTRASLVCMYSLEGPAALTPGTCLVATAEGTFHHPDLSAEGIDVLQQAAAEVLTSGTPVYADFEGWTVFAACLEPVPLLVIVGAGNDVIPVTEMAALLGWQSIVVDGRPTHAQASRFPSAQQVICAKPGRVLDVVTADAHTYFLLMTHNYRYDLEVFQLLLARQARYIGVLGPKKKLATMLLESDGWRGDDVPETVYGPIGLDLGAETAEEIALAIIAEIKAVSAGKAGIFLRDREAAIHPRAEEQ